MESAFMPEYWIVDEWSSFDFGQTSPLERFALFYHVHCFNPGKNPFGSPKGFKSSHGTYSLFNETMIQFHDIVQIFYLPYLDAFRHLFFVFQLLNRYWIPWIFINRNDTWCCRITNSQVFLKKRLAALASLVLLRKKSMVFPSESTAR